MKIHYCGEGIRGMLPGWPVCGTGNFAYRTRAAGNQTAVIIDVTCKKCLKLIRENIK
jgi:hypothetical protein